MEDHKRYTPLDSILVCEAKWKLFLSWEIICWRVHNTLQLLMAPYFFFILSNSYRLFYGVQCYRGNVNLSDFVEVISKLRNEIVYESKVLSFFNKDTYWSEYVHNTEKNIYIISKKYVRSMQYHSLFNFAGIF